MPSRKIEVNALEIIEDKMTIPRELQKELDATLESLTLEEQVSLLAGKDFWRTSEIPGKVPSIKTTDGPSGARGEFFAGGAKAAFFPSGVSLAATWDISLIHKIGVAIGEEALTKKSSVLLAPTACNHRSPLGGRNFESFSEDPYLAGKLATSYIRGVQSQKVGVTMKHFVANEQETKRFSVNELIGERALREIYLKPFEIAVREADPWGIMTSYNRINGEHADYNRFTLSQVLRKEWGFTGLVMSDWGGTNSTTSSLKAGLDLEMPGPARQRGKKLLEAAQSTNDPDLLRAIKTSARHVLELVAKTGRWGKFEEEAEEAIDKPEHRDLIRNAGTGGIVLLKNEGKILPIIPSKGVKKIAWIGPNANETIVGGGGSANLNPHYLTNPLESFKAAVKHENVQVSYEIGCRTEKWIRLFPISEGRCKTKNDGRGTDGLVAEFFSGRECAGKSVQTKIMMSSNMFLMDSKPEVLEDKDYSVRFTTYIQAEETGKHIIGLGSIGPTKVYIDDKLFIDHTKWTETGELFFTSGSEEVTSKIDLKKGCWYKFVAETTTKSPNQKLPDMGNDNLDFSSAIGLRIGIDKVWNISEYIQRAADLAGSSDTAVVIVGMNNDWESEGYDRKSMSLPGRQNDLISAVAKANPRTIVVNQSGCAFTMPWIDEVPAVLQAWYQGQEAGNALADVLLGKADPSGRLPISFPIRLEDNPSYKNFGDGGPKNKIMYKEGVFVGYRHYDTHDIPVLFPFGHGLSYTSFSLGTASITSSTKTVTSSSSPPISITLPIRNTGAISGACTIQLYLHQRSGLKILRPQKELRSFSKHTLKPGEVRKVTLEVNAQAPGYWDEKLRKWRVVRGRYMACIGTSLQNISQRVEFEVENDYTWI